MNEVIHVISSLKIGGAERFVLDLAMVQRESGVEVGIMTFGPETDPLVAEARALGLPVIVLGDVSLSQRSLVILGLVMRDRRTALHAHSPWALRQLIPVMPLLRARVIYTRHGSYPFNSRAWRLFHIYARPFVHAATFVSADGKERFATINGAWRRPFVVIENGVRLAPSPRDFSNSHRAGAAPLTSAETPPRIRLGSVGRMVGIKGQRFLLEALATMSPDDRARFELHIFGDGPVRASLEDYAREHSLTDVVTFHGSVLDRDRIYDGLDLLVVSSSTEGLSLAIMEAMARGIPVVATQVGGNGRLVLENDTGFLVPFGSAEALAQAFRRFVVEPALFTRLGAAAYSHVARHFSLQKTAREYAALYWASEDTFERGAGGESSPSIGSLSSANGARSANATSPSTTGT